MSLPVGSFPDSGKGKKQTFEEALAISPKQDIDDNVKKLSHLKKQCVYISEQLNTSADMAR